MAPVIGIIGSYGGLNVGDEAILASAIVQLRAAVPAVEIVAFCRNAEHTRQNHDVDRAVNSRDSLRDQVIPELRRLDLLLVGGGGILYDHEAKSYLREVVLAEELGIPTFAFAVGIGPLDHPGEQTYVRDGLNRMAGITVREVTAKRLCDEIGVTVPVEVTADPALLLEPLPFTDAMLQDERIPTGRPLIGLSVREKGGAAPALELAAYHDLLADVADYCVARFDAVPVFVPMEKADRNEIHHVIARMAHAEHAHVLRPGYRPRQIMGLVERLDLALGMRLHFLIFAATVGTPFLSLPYASKVKDLVASLGIRDAMPVESARTGLFLAALDRLWDTRAEHLATVAERLGPLQDLARQTVPKALATIGISPAEKPPVPKVKGEDLAGRVIAV